LAAPWKVRPSPTSQAKSWIGRLSTHVK
jgi:hypothetical protein